MARQTTGGHTVTNTALTSSTVEPVTPEYAESLGFVPSFAAGYMFVRKDDDMYYLEFRKGVLIGSYISRNSFPMERLPHLPTRYNLARIVEEFTHK